MQRMFTTREGSPSLRRRAAMWTARVLGAETVRLPDGVQDALREQSGCSRLFGETHQQDELRGRQSDRRSVRVRRSMADGPTVGGAYGRFPQRTVTVLVAVTWAVSEVRTVTAIFHLSAAGSWRIPVSQ
jgi:hypothetical protein